LLLLLVRAGAALRRDHAESWFILSAAYGLVRPDTVIDPYERSLNGMKIEARRGWARLVNKQMDMIRLGGGTAIVLAGLNYRRHLEHALLDRFAEVEIPMSGLRMGEQLRWMSEQTRISLLDT
jgi:hypothetical protein